MVKYLYLIKKNCHTNTDTKKSIHKQKRNITQRATLIKKSKTRIIFELILLGLCHGFKN